MNREELKKHITNFRLNLPQAAKFAVMGESAAVLESSQDLECEYLYVAMLRGGAFWARLTYGEMETRLEGSWTGNSWLKVYPCYIEGQVVEIDGIPCQYVPATNPYQPDPMAERPVPKLTDYDLTGADANREARLASIRKMADVLGSGMTVEDGMIHIEPQAVVDALNIDKPVGEETAAQRRFRESMPEGYNKQEDARAHERMMRGIPESPVDLILTGKNVDFADVVGDYLGLGDIVEQDMESRSATKSLLGTMAPLSDTPHSQPQAWKRGVFNTSEYRGRLVKCSEEQLKLNDDPINNLRRYNGASLKVKVTYKRRLKALARAIGNESMTARCMQSPGGHIEPEDHTVDAIRVALSSSGLVRKQLLGEGLYKPGMGRTPMREPQEEGRFYVVDNQPTEKLSEDGVLRFDSTLTNKEDGK